MQKIYKKNFAQNLIVMVVLFALLFVAFAGTTGAWFTDSQSTNVAGNTPNVSVTLYNGTTAISSSSVVTLTAMDAGTNATTLKFDLNNVADSTKNTNIPVLVRTKVVWNWTNTATDDINSIVTPNFDSNFLVKNTTSTKNGQWAYYKSILSMQSTGTIPHYTIISNFTISATMPSNVDVSIYIEAIQANKVGYDKWKNDDMPTTVNYYGTFN